MPERVVFLQVEADDILEYLEALVAFLLGSDSTTHSMTVKESILEQLSVLLQHPVIRKHSRESMVASACFLLLLTGFQGVKQPVSDLQVRWMPRNIPTSFEVEGQVSQLARQNLTAALTNIIRDRRAHSVELCFLPLRDIVLFAEVCLSSTGSAEHGCDSLVLLHAGTAEQWLPCPSGPQCSLGWGPAGGMVHSVPLCPRLLSQ